MALDDIMKQAQDHDMLHRNTRWLAVLLVLTGTSFAALVMFDDRMVGACSTGALFGLSVITAFWVRSLVRVLIAQNRQLDIINQRLGAVLDQTDSRHHASPSDTTGQ